MSFKLYSPSSNPKAAKILVAAALVNKQIELVDTPYDQLKKKDFIQRNPFAKVPVLQTNEGYIFESAAIMRYVARLNQDSKLYGANQLQSSQIDQWLDYTSLEIESLGMALLYPLFGHCPFDDFVQKRAHQELVEKIKLIDAHLKDQKWLVGDQVTIADISLATIFNSLFSCYFEEKARKSFANVLKWFENVSNLKQWRAHLGKPRFCKKQLPVPQQDNLDKDDKKVKDKNDKKDKKDKKEKKEQKLEKQEKQEKKEIQNDEPLKKKENPLDLLPPSKFNIDDYKRQFFAEKDIEKQIDYLFENLDYEGWSMWIIKYKKAENEGKQILKTNNTMKGFLQRIDPGFKKYSFAIWGVYGDEPNLEIQGAWLWRGVDIANEIKDHPSFEFHRVKKVESDQDKKMFKEFWVNQTEDESVVDGLKARVLAYWR